MCIEEVTINDGDDGKNKTTYSLNVLFGNVMWKLLFDLLCVCVCRAPFISTDQIAVARGCW